MANPWRVSPSGRLRSADFTKKVGGDGASAKIAAEFFGASTGLFALEVGSDSCSISGVVEVTGSLSVAADGTPRFAPYNWIPKTGMTGYWGELVISSSGSTLLVSNNATGQFMISTDYGESWVVQSSNNHSYLASSSNCSKLFSGAVGGEYNTSIDFGVSWTNVVTGRGLDVLPASSSDGVKLAFAEYGGQIYTSINSGSSFTPRHIVGTWWDIASSADGTKLLVVDVAANSIQVSLDSGVTWNSRGDNTRSRRCCTIHPTGWYVGGGIGQIEKSIDNGLTWVDLPASPICYYSRISISDDGLKILVMADTSGLFISEDAGETWTNIQDGSIELPSPFTYTISPDGSFIVTGFAGSTLQKTVPQVNDAAAFNGLLTFNAGTLSVTEGLDSVSFNGVLSSSTFSGSFAITEQNTDSIAFNGTVPLSTGNLSSAESTLDVLAVGGAVAISSNLASAEITNDAAALSGFSIASGSFAVSEILLDLAAFNGSAPATGSLVALELSDLDLASINGLALVSATLAVTESSTDSGYVSGYFTIFERIGTFSLAEISDSSSFNGQVFCAGDLSLSEVDHDLSAISATVLVEGTLTALELVIDALDFGGFAPATGSFALIELVADTSINFSGVVVSSGDLAATDLNDTPTLSGVVFVSGNLVALEAHDAASGNGVVLVSGSIALTETGSDSYAFVGYGIERQGTINALENGGDTVLITNLIIFTGRFVHLITYYHKGWDSAGNFVYWTSVDAPNLTPSVTVPALVGTLLDPCVIGQTEDNPTFSTTYNNRTASYTLVDADVSDSIKERIVTIAAASANTLTIPPSLNGITFNFIQEGVGQTTITAGAGVTLKGTPGLKCRAQYSGVTITKAGADVWYVVGDLAI